MNVRRHIEIEPVTRVEGHGKVTVHMNEDNEVEEARLHIVEFRGFERFIQGRFLWEAPVIVQRLCGICPVSHHIASAKAMDQIVGATQLTPTAEKVRRLMHYGQVLQSHVLHFFHLSSPDILFGFGAPAEKRNIFEVIHEHPELAKKGIFLRKYGQELIEATAGKKVHGTGATPGGVNRNISLEQRDHFLKDVDQMKDWTLDAVELVRSYCLENLDLVNSFGCFPSSHMGLVNKDGGLDLYHGGMRAEDPDGNTIFDHLDYNRYRDVLVEEVRSWSYMKFPYIKELGPEKGWYRVGPLARLNVCDFTGTEKADAALADLKALDAGKPIQSTLTNHWARMIECLHCVERIEELLHDPDLQGTDLVVKGERQHEGVGVIEAPRGNLIHQYRVDENDQITFCNLIVSTTHNNEGMNRAVTSVAKKYLDKQETITEGMLNHIEVAVRAYDPCLSCATHAIGQMPLIVETYDAGGNLIEQAKR